MNLHGIAARAVGAVNPLRGGTIQVSTGDTIGADFKPVPGYDPPQTVAMQVQALTSRDLRQLDSLNIGGSTHAIYLNGELDGLVRATNKGGDIVTLGADVYLVTAVLEQWPDWVKVSVTLQDGA